MTNGKRAGKAYTEAEAANRAKQKRVWQLTPSRPSATSLALTREQIAADVAAFVAAGGVIEQVPIYRRTDTPIGRRTWKGG